MRLEHYDEKQLKKEILEIVAKHLNLDRYRVFFFGSRVSGRGDERSDIDVGIEGSKPIPFEKIAEIREEVAELPILYKIDVIDFRGADADFRKVAKQHVEFITQ